MQHSIELLFAYFCLKKRESMDCDHTEVGVTFTSVFIVIYESYGMVQ